MAKKYKIGDEDEEIKNEQAGDGENNKKVKLGGIITLSFGLHRYLL